METQAEFGVINYIVLFIILSVSMGIGIYFALVSRNKVTRTEYLLGGKGMRALPVCISLFATFQSAISLLGNPAEIYTYGTMKMYDIIGVSLTFPTAMVTSVALLYPLGATSINEYLLLRFESAALRRFGAFIGIVGNLSYMTTALLAPALALETVVGVPLWVSIIVVGAVGTLYTTVGGIKSVIWTDVFQSVIVFSGIILVLIVTCVDAGSPHTTWKVIEASGRLDFDNFDLDPRTRHTVWGVIIGSFWYWLAFHFSQSCVQRIVSLRSFRDATVAYLMWMPLNALYSAMLYVLGLVTVAYFWTKGCDPLAAGYIDNNNQLEPYLVIDIFNFLPGLSGLFISTIFSGALSTISSGINSLAANTVEDLLFFAFRGKPEAVVTLFTKLVVCIYGSAVIGLTYLIMNFDGPISQISYVVTGTSNGPLLGMFLLGGLFPQANYVGAFTGCITAFVITTWQAIGSSLYGYRTPTLSPGPTNNCAGMNLTVMTYSDSIDTYLLVNEIYKTDSTYGCFFYDLSYIWNPMIGVLVTIIVGLATSIVINKYMKWKPTTDLRYIFPFIRRIWLPKERGQIGD